MSASQTCRQVASAGQAVEDIDGAGRGVERTLTDDDQPHRLELERGAQLEDVDDVVGADDRELHPAVGDAAEQTFVDEDLGGGAERVAGDAEPRREVRLAQPRPGLELAAEDHLAKGLGRGLDGGDGAQWNRRL